MTAAMQFLINLLLLVVAPVAYGAEHLVVGGAGWSKDADYTAWSAGENFTVGDTLVFKYGKDHLVYEVTEDDYKKCGMGNPINVHSGGAGHTVIPLDKPGPRYFISPTFGHCAGGMKLAINVKDGKYLGRGGSGNTIPVTPRDVNIPSPPMTIPGGGGAPLKCPGGGGGGSPNPPNPFIFGPPNPFIFAPPNPYPYPYPNHHGGASNLGKMSGLMMGFYSLFVLVISLMVY